MRQKFEQRLRALCCKYYDIINDPMWAYEDLLQEGYIIEFEMETSNKRYLKMNQSSRESYLYRSITNSFKDIARRMKKKKEIDERSASGEIYIEEDDI